MTNIVNGTPVAAPLSAGTDTTNTWPTHLASLGAGGFEVVDTIAERDAITSERRDDKLVLVMKGASGKQELYLYEGSSWVKQTLPSSLSVSDGIDKFEAVKDIIFNGCVATTDGSGTVTVTVKATPGSGTVDSGIGIVSDSDTALGVKDINLYSMVMETDKAEPTRVAVTPYTTFVSEAGKTEEGLSTTEFKGNKVTAIPPLKLWSDPNTDLGVMLELPHDTFETMHAPSYLAYVKGQKSIIGKEGSNAHHDGCLWFDDIITPSGAFIATDRATKTFSLQEGDTLDPNVTGGTDYLVVFRIHMQGVAPDDGKVRIYIWDKTTNKYLLDINGNPMGSQRVYKAGEELGFVSVMGVVNAKGIQDMTCHVIDDFTDDRLVISSRTRGASGILIQALTPTQKTSNALQQFELDSGQIIDFESTYYGADLMSMAWMLQSDLAKVDKAAGTSLELDDGTVIRAIGETEVSVKDKTLQLRSADFLIGKLFDTLDTKMLQSKTIRAYTEMSNPDGDIVLALFKWTGRPGEATKEIYTGHSQGGGIQLQPNWEEVDQKTIVADALGDFKTYSKDFIVPDDAVSIAIAIYPSLGNTTDNVRIKGLNADVRSPFSGYIVDAPELRTEAHLINSPRYLKLVQDRGPHLSIRYTINKLPTTGVPMPCGVITSGNADITTDPSVNKVSGSRVGFGEGAIKFNAKGRAIVKTSVYLYAGEQLTKGQQATVRFWYARVESDGKMTEIKDSETSILLSYGEVANKCNLLPFGLDVEPGDRIALLAITDEPDDAYLMANTSNPLLITEIDFTELLVK